MACSCDYVAIGCVEINKWNVYGHNGLYGCEKSENDCGVKTKFNATKSVESEKSAGGIEDGCHAFVQRAINAH